MNTLDSVAIDFEIATGQCISICEVGVCLVRSGEIAETRSWLVQPEGSRYSYWNTQCHSIRPEDMKRALPFAEAWQETTEQCIGEGTLLVAHNMPFDRGYLGQAAQLYELMLPELQWGCLLRRARQICGYGYRMLAYPCEQLSIPEGRHHRAGDGAEMCTHLYLHELHDSYENYTSVPSSRLFEIENDPL